MPMVQLFQNEKAKGRGNNTESGIWRVCVQGDKTNQEKTKVANILPLNKLAVFPLGAPPVLYFSYTMSSLASN